MSEILANKKQLDAVKDYITKRFASYGIVGYKLKVEETPRLTYGQRIWQEIELNSLGIFQHALKKCELKIEIWRRDKDSVVNTCSVGLSYEHFNGGTNGCDIDCTLIVNIEGDVIEKYK